VLNRVDQPFWKAAALEPDSLSDQAVGMTWRGGELAAASAKEPACLTVFAGGQAAQAWLQRSPAQRRELASQELDTLFPGYNGHSQSQIFCLWPNEPWTRCGYSAPSRGDSTVGRCWPAAWPAGLISFKRADQARPAQALSSFGYAAEGGRLLCDR